VNTPNSQVIGTIAADIIAMAIKTPLNNITSIINKITNSERALLNDGILFWLNIVLLFCDIKYKKNI
jgi:hypothetical protein